MMFLPPIVVEEGSTLTCLPIHVAFVFLVILNVGTLAAKFEDFMGETLWNALECFGIRSSSRFSICC